MTAPSAEPVRRTGEPDQTRSDRQAAVIIGTLFIVAIVPFMIGGAVYGPSTGAADFLTSAHPNRGAVTAGVLIEFVAVMAIPLIGVFFFPVLRRFHEALALAYVGFRAIEAVLLVAIEGKLLSLVDLSDDHLDAAGADGTTLQAIGDARLAEVDAAFGLYVLVFTVGALVLYGLLAHSRLIPRWLALWGLGSAAWMLIGTVLIQFDTFSGSDGLVEAVFVLPLPLNEIALALWLIFRGFDAPAERDGPTRVTPSTPTEVRTP